MKNTLFYVTRILATVIVIAALSFIGIGNPKVVPFFALFFIAVFALVYFLNKKARERDREAKSGTFASSILQILGLVVFVGVFSALGLLHGVIGYIVWFLVVSIIVAAVYLMVRNRQRQFDVVPTSGKGKKAFVAILAVLAVILPLLILIFGGMAPITEGKGGLAVALAIIGTLLFIGLVGYALILINKKGDVSSNRLLGYLLIIIAALLPGILVLFVSKESQTVAVAYIAALVALVASYLALNARYQLS
ncbi:MAG: hypothetical protein K0B87_05605 [Candidatus Syntrophosphaera sp.]|nr:hypothetical protein [Candidatus Syntrophosphaera sp.]